MGMFDYYQPHSALACPMCGKPLGEWQGKDGPCGLFVWKQGVPAPIDQIVDADVCLESEALAKVRLPTSFLIYTHCCSTKYAVEARCTAPDNTWSSIELVTTTNATRRKEETRAAFKERLKWLSTAAV